MSDYATGADGLPQEIVGAWALEKHQILHNYIDASRSARARMGGSPCLVDLFCGPGRIQVRETGIVRAGGTVIGLHSSLVAVRGTPSPFERVFFADVSADMTNACEYRLRACSDTVSLCPFVGAAAETAPAISRELPRRGIHVAYLDPYALFALPFSVLRALSEAGNVDLLIHFAAADMSRNLQRPDLRDRFELVAPGWIAASKIQGGKSEMRRRFFAHWRELLTGLGYHVAERSFQVKNDRGRELYRLVLASKHTLGANIWDSLRPPHPQTGFW